MHSSSSRTLSLPPLGAVAAPKAMLPPSPEPVIRPVQPKLTEERLAEMEQAAYETGFTNGQRDGIQAGQQTVQRAISALERLAEQADQVRAQLVTDARTEVASLAVAVAAQVLGYEVNQDHPVVVAGLQAAKAHFAPSTPLALHINPQDMPVVNVYNSALTEALGDAYELLPDDGVARGGAVVEGDGRIVDANLVTRFESVVAQMVVQLS